MGATRFVSQFTALAVAAATATVLGGTGPATASSGTYTNPGAITVGQASTTAGGADIAINDLAAATPYPSTATVAGLVGGVTDVNLTLRGVTHTYPDDIDVMLVSPSGKRAIVMSDAGGETVISGIDVTLDDQAGQALPDESALAAGTYRPADYETGDPFAAPAPDASGAGSALSVFNDSNANGTWQLFVMDDSEEDTGSIASWRLDVTTTGPQPYPSSLVVSGADNSITDVDVVLTGVTHTSPSDIDMLLVGPGGQQATILSDAGSDADVNGINVVLDDDAGAPVPSPMVAGTFRPTNSGGADAFPAPAPAASGASALSAFDGTNPNGTWTLYVADDTTGDTGTISSWGLRINAADTIPPHAVKVSPGPGLRGVSRTADIKVTFSESIRPATLSKKTIFLTEKGSTTKIKAAIRYKSAKNRAVLDPKGKLQAGTRYQVFVTNRVKDAAGNRLDQSSRIRGPQGVTWSFRTR